MISFVGYNFLSDLNSVDPYPTNAGTFNQVEIYRAIYDHIDISNDTTITSNIHQHNGILEQSSTAILTVTFPVVRLRTFHRVLPKFVSRSAKLENLIGR